MKYEAILNSAVYNCGYKWVVIDEDWKTVGTFLDRESAEKAAMEMNEGDENIS